MFVYVLLGTGGAVWIGEVGDLKSLVARVETGKGLPKALRAHQPVGLAAVVGPARHLSALKHLKAVLWGLGPERLRAFLAGAPEEASLLAGLFPDCSLTCWTGDPMNPRAWVPTILSPRGAEFAGHLRVQRQAPACKPGDCLELLRQRLDGRYWRVLLGRTLDRRTCEDLARELGSSRERIRQMAVKARLEAHGTLRTLLGPRWEELSSLCQEALEGWALLSEEALAEEARRLWGTEWEAVDREERRLLFHLLTRGLVSREAWGRVVYSLGKRDVGSLVEDFLRAAGPPEGCSEVLGRLWRAERRRFQEARGPRPGLRGRPATVRGPRPRRRKSRKGSSSKASARM